MDIQPERIERLNNLTHRREKYVLYWMQQSQRARANHSLEHAVARANHLNLPLVTIFALTPNYPDANLRHYSFMLAGLRETARQLADRGIPFILRQGHPPAVVLQAAKNAALIICDRGYLNHQKSWRKQLAANSSVEVVQVESDAVVPVQTASNRAEFAARTLRPKIHKQLNRFLIPPPHLRLKHKLRNLQEPSLDINDTAALLNTMQIHHAVPPVTHFTPGTAAAENALQTFISNHLGNYVTNRNRPENDDVSHMSMYLHFGQISPLWIALQMQNADAPSEARESYLEELIIRRELSINFCNFTPHYHKYLSIPPWARASLRRHTTDKRDYLYTPRQMEHSKTHDIYWNAAMDEMRLTGYMHNYMRMYWGKKILEWSPTPEQAFRTTLTLNNKYFLDGRDPVSYANVGWIFGLHDRPWAERPIFGTIRYMSASGLERKANPQAYVQKVKHLHKPAEASDA